jgi:hypothetical protein
MNAKSTRNANARLGRRTGTPSTEPDAARYCFGMKSPFTY